MDKKPSPVNGTAEKNIKYGEKERKDIQDRER